MRGAGVQFSVERDTQRAPIFNFFSDFNQLRFELLAAFERFNHLCRIRFHSITRVEFPTLVEHEHLLWNCWDSQYLYQILRNENFQKKIMSGMFSIQIQTFGIWSSDVFTNIEEFEILILKFDTFIVALSSSLKL